MRPVRVTVVVVVTILLQVCLFSRFSYEGARPDVVLLLAVAAGLALGPDQGAVVGFAAGLSFDLLLTTPMGLSALVYLLVGYGSGVVGATFLRSAWWIAPVVVAVASGAGILLYALVGTILGEATFAGPSVTDIVVVVSSVNAVLAALAVRALRWVRSDEVERGHHMLLR